MKVKLFWVRSPTSDKGFVVSDHRGDNAMAFEKQVNDWLAKNPDIDIVHIKQSAWRELGPGTLAGVRVVCIALDMSTALGFVRGM